MISEIDVLEFENKMAANFGMSIIRDKEAYKQAKYFATAVGIFTSISGEDFLQNYTQTLYKWIFLASKWETFSPMCRMATIIHECVHGRQFKKDWGMPTRYTLNVSYRAIYEAEAKSASMLFHAHVEKPEDLKAWGEKYIDEAVERLIPYGIKGNDSEFVKSKMMSDLLTYMNTGDLIYEEARLGCKLYDKLNND